jgi:hypothetical protein
MKFLVSLAVGLSLLVSTEAVAFRCLGPCILPQAETCTEFIAHNDFSNNDFPGDCCSLKDDLDSGGCNVTVSDGSCYWRDKNWECDPQGCFSGFISYSSDSTDPCPASDYDVFATTEPTSAPSIFATTEPTSAPSIATTDASVEPTPAPVAPTDASGTEALWKNGELILFLVPTAFFLLLG